MRFQNVCMGSAGHQSKQLLCRRHLESKRGVRIRLLLLRVVAGSHPLGDWKEGGGGDARGPPHQGATVTRLCSSLIWSEKGREGIVEGCSACSCMTAITMPAAVCQIQSLIVLQVADGQW